MKIIQSELFGKFPDIKFGFSTIDGGVSPDPFWMNLSLATNDVEENVLRNRDLFFGELEVSKEKINFQKQIHSDISKSVHNGGFCGECDATYTNIKNVFLTVSVADCLPVFLFDPERKVVAAIHAGWRGTVDSIVAKTIKNLIDEYSVDPSDLVAYMGPCISQEYFEVGLEVGAFFGEEVKLRKGEKFHIDLKKENRNQLIKSGVSGKKIEISPYCTYKEKDLFHSYRRDRDRSGRMLGVIGMI